MKKIILSLGIALSLGQVLEAQQTTKQVAIGDECKDFELMTLPYATNALEPVISQATIELHHGKHLKGYVTNLNKLLVSSSLKGLTLEQIVRHSEGALFNNAGQTLNHNLYFSQFSPKPQETQPRGELLRLIEEGWGSFEAFRTTFEAEGAKLFGSGWLWLSRDDAGSLQISLHAGGDNPVSKGWLPLLGIDLWEHAYYLDYQNRRAEHLKALWRIIDWSVVEKRLPTKVAK